jgi:hypothetical protein
MVDIAKNNGCKIILYGHTHIKKIEELDGLYIINPGSITKPRNKESNTFLEIDYDKTLINVEFDGVEKLSYKNKVNSKIGSIIYKYDGKVISSEDVLLNFELEPDYIKIIMQYKFYILVSIFIILLLFLIKIKKRKKHKRK